MATTQKLTLKPRSFTIQAILNKKFLVCIKKPIDGSDLRPFQIYWQRPSLPFIRDNEHLDADDALLICDLITWIAVYRTAGLQVCVEKQA